MGFFSTYNYTVSTRQAGYPRECYPSLLSKGSLKPSKTSEQLNFKKPSSQLSKKVTTIKQKLKVKRKENIESD